MSLPSSNHTHQKPQGAKMKLFCTFIILLGFIFSAQASEPRDCTIVGGGMPPAETGITEEVICKDVEIVMLEITDMAADSNLFLVTDQSGPRESFALSFFVFYTANDNKTKQVNGTEFWNEAEHYFELK
jgi:hypothetical protein